VNESKLIVMGVKGSVNAHNCGSIEVEGFCSQLRLSNCSDVTLHVQTNSCTALVDSRGVRVGAPPNVPEESPMRPVLDLLGVDIESFNQSAKWRNVKDFNCLGGNSPNWQFITV
jgi:hypothetical protein